MGWVRPSSKSYELIILRIYLRLCFYFLYLPDTECTKDLPPHFRSPCSSLAFFHWTQFFQAFTPYIYFSVIPDTEQPCKAPWIRLLGSTGTTDFFLPCENSKNSQTIKFTLGILRIWVLRLAKWIILLKKEIIFYILRFRIQSWRVLKIIYFQIWWCTPIIALGKWRQEDQEKYKVFLGSMESSRSAWTAWDPVSKHQELIKFNSYKKEITIAIINI